MAWVSLEDYNPALNPFGARDCGEEPGTNPVRTVLQTLASRRPCPMLESTK
jgi:hypothetical protein